MRIREILPSDYLQKHTNNRIHASTVSLFLISPMALCHFGELEMTDLFFPVQTAEFELSNSLTENIEISQQNNSEVLFPPQPGCWQREI